MSTKAKKPTEQQTVKQLEKRIRLASVWLGCAATDMFDESQLYYRIDQAVRRLQGPNYKKFVKEYTKGDEGPDTFVWCDGDNEQIH